MASIDIGASVTEFMAKRKEGFAHDRTKTVGASEIGGCARMVGYRKSSTPVDEGYDDSTGAAARGDIMEDGWSAPLLRMAVEAIGGTLLWAGQQNQMSLVNEKAFVSATPDGLAVNMPKDCLKKYGIDDIMKGIDAKLKSSGAVLDCIVIEFKSYDPRSNVSKFPKPQHVDQVNLQMGLIRSTDFVDEKTGELVRYAPTYGIIVYTDASDYTKMHVAVVQYDHKGYLGQLTRAKHIMTAAGWVWDEENDCPAWRDEDGNFFDKSGGLLKAVELLRPEGKITGSGECRYCAFAKRCTGYAALVPKVAQVPSKKVVTSIRKLAHMLQTEKDKIEEAKANAGRIEADLKEAMAGARTNFLDPEVTGDVTLFWKRSEGKEVNDTAAMQKWIENAAKKMKVTPPSFKKTTKPSESLSVEFVEALAK